MQVAIFCSVIDNFGDIGICWRLARQLSAEHQWQVQLYVDDLSAFKRICPEVEPALAQQQILSIEVIAWTPTTHWPAQTPDVVIEALACQVPTAYLQQVAQQNPQAIWLNLEYLSAEAWVEGCHGLPSLQPEIQLKKYFFFPGFTPATGGLLREQHIVAQAEKIRQDKQWQQRFWQQLQVDDFADFVLKVSLFAYGQTQIKSWLITLSQQPERTLLLVPEGVLAEQIRAEFPILQQASRLEIATLTVQMMPFMPQQDYDLLLALCDVNFVRGEDSVIRAHWAGRPFIWQIYRQAEQAHRQKLHDFLTLQLASAPQDITSLVRRVHDSWDLEEDFSEIWSEYRKNLDKIQKHTVNWQQFLTQQQDLASNLVRFVEKKLIMPRNFS